MSTALAGLPENAPARSSITAAASPAKRVLDMVGALLLLAVFLPVFAFTAWRIWRFDGGPVFFAHQRVGRGRVPFRCWKFRTMTVDAEARLATVLAEHGVENGVFAKLKDDPRITGPGRWLRRSSLDELPQLVNVLLGEMSLVGPRPHTAHEVAQYDETMSRRLCARPGMTGLWQVSGRSDLPVPEGIRLDLDYVDNWSMRHDFTIMCRTFPAVVRSRGAY